MPFYQFTIRKGAGRTEALGGMGLPNDAEALAFGKQVIQDLIHTDPARYAGWTMDITNGDGLMIAVPFDIVELKK